MLDTYWATDHNRLAVEKVSDKRFDEMWLEGGTVGRDVPAYHWDCLAALLAPPPVSIGRSTTGKRLPDPPRLETFHPQVRADVMPIGVLSENGQERMVGVSWGGPTDPLVDWTVGATGSGKTWHAQARAITVAESDRGFLFVDPHRAAVAALKQFLAAHHADRILEIDLQATDSAGEPVSAGWNPLDLTVVSEKMRKGRIDTLKGVLGVALFPDYFGRPPKHRKRRRSAESVGVSPQPQLSPARADTGQHLLHRGFVVGRPVAGTGGRPVPARDQNGGLVKSSV